MHSAGVNLVYWCCCCRYELHTTRRRVFKHYIRHSWICLLSAAMYAAAAQQQRGRALFFVLCSLLLRYEAGNLRAIRLTFLWATYTYRTSTFWFISNRNVCRTYVCFSPIMLAMFLSPNAKNAQLCLLQPCLLLMP